MYAACPPRGAARVYVLAIAAAGAIGIVIAAVCLCGNRQVEGKTPEERVASIQKLAADDPFGAGKVIAAAAANEPEPAVRAAAFANLGAKLTPELRPAVEQGTRDREAGVRVSAVATLALYKDEGAADRLGHVLAEDPDETVRFAAVGGLGLNSSPKAIVHLLSTAEGNSPPAVRQSALRAVVSKIGLRMVEKVGPQDGRRWRTIVEELKHDRNIQSAYAACGVPLVFRPEDKTPNQPGHDGP